MKYKIDTSNTPADKIRSMPVSIPPASGSVVVVVISLIVEGVSRIVDEVVAMVSFIVVVAVTLVVVVVIEQGLQGPPQSIPPSP
jgi:Mn2+/Fe2+ NRAMP family transporter